MAVQICLLRKLNLNKISSLMAQVEDLTQKTQLQEAELERTTIQLKEARTMAGDEIVKCKAAKEVVKLLTAQVRHFHYCFLLH